MNDILVAIDGSGHSDKVVDFATNLAKNSGSSVRLLYVVKKLAEKPEGVREFEHAENFHDAYAEYLQDLGNSVTSKLGARIKESGVEFETLVEVGNPAEIITDTARADKAKYIVVGLKGLHGVARLRSLGSIARRVIENAHCPVFVVPS
jgi:nucleotide-binding universal stress UspA family protein